MKGFQIPELNKSTILVQNEHHIIFCTHQMQFSKNIIQLLVVLKNTNLSTFLVWSYSTGELNTRLALGLQVKFKHTKMITFAEDIIGLLSEVSIVWGSHILQNSSMTKSTYRKCNKKNALLKSEVSELHLVWYRFL